VSVVNLTASHKKQDEIVTAVWFKGGNISINDACNPYSEECLNINLDTIEYNLRGLKPFTAAKKEENAINVFEAQCHLSSILEDVKVSNQSKLTKLAFCAVKLETLKERDLQYKNKLQSTTKIPREWAHVKKVS
jgi:antitoxin (DNA-binding transcriptional repressor) of toxin-antitoxin stability system